MKLENLIWFEKYRPKQIADMSMSVSHKKAFDEYVASKNVPHILLAGVQGSGKTTIAQILLKQIPCHKLVLNASGKDRGIDTIKGPVVQFASSMPEKGKINIVFLDECFAKGSKVRTIHGDVPIQNIKVGDLVHNLHGVDEVVAVHINKVQVDRVVSILFTNGNRVVCSEDHLFLVNEQWVKAKDLADMSLLCYSSEYLTTTIKQMEHNNAKTQATHKIFAGTTKGLQHLWESIYFRCMERTGLSRLQKAAIKRMRILQKRIFSKAHGAKVLLADLRREVEKWAGIIQEKAIYSRSITKDKRKQREMGENRSWIRTCKEYVNTYAKSKCPGSLQNSNRERNNNSQDKWDIVVREEGGQWTHNKSAESIIYCLGLADRSCYLYGSEYFKKEERILSEQENTNNIQSRRWESSIEDRNRNRWQRTQEQGDNAFGFKKEDSIRRIGVESITFYKSGNNREHFEGIIGDTERNEGFVEFYDLSIKENSSYIVSGFIVHNCDQLTTDAQNAMKNTMETYSSNTRFILTCNNIDKIVPPIQSRCIKYSFDQLPKKKLVRLLQHILKSENIEDVPEPELEKLISKFYPDIRSVVNNLQAACLTGIFDPKAMGALQVDPAKIGAWIKEGKLFSIRQYISGTMDFSFLYKWLFDVFIMEVPEENRPEAAKDIATFAALDRTVPDREMQMASCCITLMLSCGSKISFTE